MSKFPKPIERLIDELGELPGVGPKTAERYAFHLLRRGVAERRSLAEAIMNTDRTIGPCSVCRNYTETDPCAICSDPRRDRDVICVVANEQDLLALEHTSEHCGTYHILGGTLSAANGVTPDQLNIRELVRRVKSKKPKEMILAFDPTIEGESTMLYLTRTLSTLGIKLTKLARGLPIGSELGYADELTLSDALRGRSEITVEKQPSSTK